MASLYGHEAFVVASGAACVPLQAKVCSMTQRRKSGQSRHQQLSATFIKHSPGVTRADQVSA
jgi:hypothetical protein